MAQEIRSRAMTESVKVDGEDVFQNGGLDGHGHGTHCAGIAAGVCVGGGVYTMMLPLSLLTLNDGVRSGLFRDGRTYLPLLPQNHHQPGRNVGIAPSATIRCVKVLDDSGSGMLDHVVAGLNTVANAKRNNPNRAMVASLSLGAAASTVRAGRVGRGCMG